MRIRVAALFTAVVSVASLLLGIAPASAASAPVTPELRHTLANYGLPSSLDGIVVDSAMTYNQAIGDDQVPANLLKWHMQIRPYLRVVPVVHWGYDGRVHVGQIVVNVGLVDDINKLFIGMFVQRFPIYSVIPESKFGYVDDNSMAANNSSGYRPDTVGTMEHFKGAAFDINPLTNPEDMLQPDGSRFIDPPGASYDPTAQGAITMEGGVRKLWTSFGYEWGGNWGNPNADPPTDFYKVGFFDYQHFQLNYLRIDTEPLPAGWIPAPAITTTATARADWALAG